jgi:hypothetical protein
MFPWEMGHCLDWVGNDTDGSMESSVLINSFLIPLYELASLIVKSLILINGLESLIVESGWRINLNFNSLFKSSVCTTILRRLDFESIRLMFPWEIVWKGGNRPGNQKGGGIWLGKSDC